MKYLKITNTGLLDIRLIGLMGGTTKKNDKFKIGQFGTGLKYVLSFLIRNNIDFKVFIGEREIKVTTELEVIRDQEFNIISIDGKRTSITCQMGHEWKAWMIIREIWCNALDEGGAKKEVTTDPCGEDDATVFCIQLTPEISEVLNNWNEYFIHDAVPFFENDHCRIYHHGKEFRVYKQGVLIHRNPKIESLFAYDIKDAEINELREYKGTLAYDIVKCLYGMDASGIEYFLEHITEKHYEGIMDYNWDLCGLHFTDTWRKVIGNAKIIKQKQVDDIKARGLDIDLSSVLIMPTSVYAQLTKDFEGISAVRLVDKVNEFYEGYLPALELRIKEALAILESCDYWIDPELKFTYGSFGDKNKYAQVNFDSKEVFFSEQLMDKSLFEVVTTIIEENEHFKTGFQDCSRTFQQHFINLFTKTLMDKCEVKL